MAAFGIVLYVGETHVTFNCAWKDDSSAVVDLSGATLTVRWHTDTKGNSSRAGDGTFAFVSAVNGTFTYKVSTNDVATADNWQLQFKAVYADTTVLFSDPIGVELRAAL